MNKDYEKWRCYNVFFVTLRRESKNKDMKRLIVTIFALFVMAGNMSLWAQVRVGVLLPLKERSSRGTTMIEFYRGLLMAVDQLKQDGHNVEVFTLDAGTSEESMRSALNEGTLAQSDVIFGPADVSQVTLLAAYCKEHAIRMVLPFNTPCPQVYSNPYVYVTGVAQELLFPVVTTLVMREMENSNFVFYETGETDERGRSFYEHLKQIVNLRGLQSTMVHAVDGISGIAARLNQFRKNVIISDSRSQTSLVSLVNNLKAFRDQQPEYKISLLGYPEWLTYTNSMLRDYYLFDTYVYSPYYRNPLSGRVAKFEQRYLQNFGQAGRNTFPKAEMLGYDLGLYFLYGLATMGNAFDAGQDGLEQKALQHTFHFQRVGELGGYVNLHAQLVHYTTFNTIQEIR